MKYALLIHSNDEQWERRSEEEQKAIYGRVLRGLRDPRRPRRRAAAAGRRPPRRSACGTASTLTTDGPFAETKEALGGFFLFEADDLDAAIELAARIPAARLGGAVEVRPIVER